MRWESLFADLGGQLDAAERLELDDEVAERVRGETGTLRLVDRLRAAVGRTVAVRLRGEARLEGAVTTVGAEWFTLRETGGREVLVALGAVLAVSGVGSAAAVPGSEGPVTARLGLRYALRRLARDRAVVAVRLVDGSAVTGTLDRVGADFVEIAEHALDVPRREGAVVRRTLVHPDAVATVREA